MSAKSGELHFDRQGGDADAARAFDRILGVEHEIEQGRLELNGFRVDPPRLRVLIDLERNVTAQRGAQQRLQLRQNGSQIDLPARQQRRSGKVQQAPHLARSVLARVANRVDEVHEIGAVADTLQQQFGGAADRGQEVVEVVRCHRSIRRWHSDAEPPAPGARVASDS